MDENLRANLDALLGYWREMHRVRMDAYQSAISLDPINLDPQLRTNFDYAAGAVAALAMLSRGELPSGPGLPPIYSGE